VSRADFLRTFPRVFDGTHARHPAVTIRRGKEVTVEMPDAADDPELWASGERVGVLPAHLDVAPRAVRVVTSP
jgi:diacylglycerol kinase (ATP)